MSRLPSTIAVGNKEIPLGITLADRLVNWLNPVAGQERLGSRARTALFFGGYTAADKTRRANQKGGKREMDADTAIVPDLATLREDSQHLARNNPLASGALKTNITKVVGTGLRVKATVDRAVLGLTEDQANQWEQSAEREFNLATATRELDLERDMPFSLLQGLAFLRVLEDGDLLVNMPRVKRAGSPYATKLQLIEAARVCNPGFAADTNTTIAGVTKDAYGAAQIFHVCNRHPNARRYLAGKANTEFSWQSLPAFAANGTPLVLHLKDKTRPGQTRGVPYLAPVIELIKQLGRYTDAEVMAAVVSGMFTVFVYSESGNPEFGPAPTMDNPTGDRNRQADPTGIEMGYGSVVGLREGQKMDFANPTRPNAAFDPFFVAIVRQIGMCLELPFEVLIKHFTSSYSAARAAFLDAWDYFYRRRHWLACQFCQPVYEAIVTEAVIFGRLSAPGFLFDPLIRQTWLGTRWVGDAPGEIDPLKAVNAAQARVNMHLTTLEQEYEELIGGDHEAIQPQIVRETNWKRENGLAAPVSVSSIDVDPDEQED
ncbi:phage portal protein [Desulfobulbus sp.]|uniref:phage portal protein n=1 Tax=Desulfobulbus sp. TaxID=895 RepID=UPI00286F14FE|nr:phage portal protein [Desulfobulbus sp.]